MKKRLTTLKRAGLTLVGAMAAGSVMAHQPHEHHGRHHQTQAESHGGLKVINPENHDYWFSVGGRLAFDETQFSGSTNDKGPNYPSGANIRRAFLKFAGGVGPSLSYNLTLDFTGANGVSGSNASTVDFQDAYVNLEGSDFGFIQTTNLRFGQFTPPTSIDAWGNEGTQNDTMFLESALATTAFSVPTKVYGVWVDASAMDMFMFSVSAYQPRQKNSINNTGVVNNNFGDAGRSDRLGGSARLTVVPVHTDDTVYHLGVVGRFQSMNNGVAGNAITQPQPPYIQPGLFSTAPEARARNTNMLVTTGPVRARSYNVVTGEALALFGPVTVAAEYSEANVQRVPNITDTTSNSNPRFHGWHVEGGYMLTGESRQYDFTTGTLRNPKVTSKCGAWELAARFSFANLVDKNVYGGSEHNTTVGLNWFVNDNVRVALNYIRANIRPTAVFPVTPAINAPGVPVKRTLDIVGLRFGVMF